MKQTSKPVKLTPQEVQFCLAAIFEAKGHELERRQDNGLLQIPRALANQVAEALSMLAGRPTAWSGRALVQYYQHPETYRPGAKLIAALLTMGERLDGVNPTRAGTIAVEVYAQPGTILPGTVILRPTQRCHNPLCGIFFIGSPTQKYCCKKCRQAAYRLRRKQKESANG